MGIFVKADEIDVIASGVRYLRIEGAFYIGIGWLFLLYGYFRAIKKPACQSYSQSYRSACASFSPMFGIFYRRDRHLDVDSDWLGTC